MANNVDSVQTTGSGQQNSNNSPSLEQLQHQISSMNQMMILMMNKKAGFTSPEDQVHSMEGMAYCLNTSMPYYLCQLWIVDTGASHHMCCNKDLLTDIISLTKPFQVALPNKQLISITHSGVVHLNEHIILSNVLYVPEFHCNLLSVSKLTQDSNCFVNFFSHNCVFQDQTREKVLATGEHHDGLYYLTQ